MARKARILNPLRDVGELKADDRVTINGRAIPPIGDYAAPCGVKVYNERFEGYVAPLEIIREQFKPGKLQPKIKHVKAGKKALRVVIPDEFVMVRTNQADEDEAIEARRNPDHKPYGNWSGKNLI